MRWRRRSIGAKSAGSGPPYKRREFAPVAALLDPAGDDRVRARQALRYGEARGDGARGGKRVLQLARRLRRRRRRLARPDRRLRGLALPRRRQRRLFDLLAGRLARPIAARRIGHAQAIANLGEALAGDAVAPGELAHRCAPDLGIELVAAERDRPLCLVARHDVSSRACDAGGYDASVRAVSQVAPACLDGRHTAENIDQR